MASSVRSQSPPPATPSFCYNCLNGGKGRLAPTVTALGVMLCTIVAYPVLDFIPIASLAGVMIVVVLHTFKWGKIDPDDPLGRAPRQLA